MFLKIMEKTERRVEKGKGRREKKNNGGLRMEERKKKEGGQ